MEITGLTQPNVSNHLACLLDCSLVRREQQGRFAIYSLADLRTRTLLEIADAILNRVSENIDNCENYAEAGTRPRLERRRA